MSLRISYSAEVLIFIIAVAFFTFSMIGQCVYLTGQVLRSGHKNCPGFFKLLLELQGYNGSNKPSAHHNHTQFQEHDYKDIL